MDGLIWLAFCLKKNVKTQSIKAFMKSEKKERLFSAHQCLVENKIAMSGGE
jgi:hypothetical protein